MRTSRPKRRQQKSTRSERIEIARRYRANLRRKAIEATANRCEECGSTKQLEFAHREPTGLSGRSRGSLARYRDVIKNPQSYLRLCWSCHREYDANAESAAAECSGEVCEF